jgi:predicted transcriptional regulator
MKQLTKVQVEAIVEEVQERLGSLSTSNTLTPRAEKEWESLKDKFEQFRTKEKEIEDLDEKLDKLKEDAEDFEREIKEEVRRFEKKHKVGVEWQYVDYDEGEQPEVKFPASDFTDKIRRQIAILSIDKKDGPVTADSLIETIINKFS